MPPASRDPRRGYALLLTGAVLFGLTGPVGKVILDAGVSPARLTALRCTGSAIGLTVVLALRGHGFRATRRELPALVVVGLCGAALIQWCYFIAVDRLPIGIALLLEFTAPVLVALYTRFIRRERLAGAVWIGLAGALIGLALVAQLGGGGGLDPVGVTAGLAAAACLATFYLVAKHSLGGRDPISLSWWMFAVASVFWAVAQPWWRFDGARLGRSVSMLGHLAEVTVPLWLPVVWIVVLGTLVPYALTMAALHHLTPTTTGIVGMLEPVVAATVAWAWLAQALTGSQVVGGLLVLGAVAVVQTATIRTAAR